MMGEPKDVEGKCNARLFIADNWGDNHATMLCSLAAKHPGLPHCEDFGRGRVEWAEDERDLCPAHGDDEHRWDPEICTCHREDS